MPKIWGFNMQSYCGSYSNEVPVSKDDFSLCFEDSVLSWTACILCIFIGLIYMTLASRSKYTYPKLTVQFLVTLIGGVASLIPQIMILSISLKDGINVPVLKWNAVLIILTTVFITFITWYERTKGNISVFPVYLFWTMMALYNLVKLRTLLTGSIWQETAIIDKTLPILFCVHLGLCSLNVVLQSIREVPSQLKGTVQEGDKTYVDIGEIDNLILDPEENMLLEEDNHRMKYDRLPYDNRKPCPSEFSTFISVATFHWLTSVVWKGFKKPLEDKDLYHVPYKCKTEQIIYDFYKKWTGDIPCPETGKTSCKGNRSIVLSLFLANWKTVMAAVILKIGNDLLMFVPPQILKQLIFYREYSKTLPVSYGLTYCVLLIASLVLQTFCIQNYFDNAISTGMKIRVALVSAIYRKALMLSNAGQKSSQLGQMINLMQVDAQKFQDMMTYLNMIWSAPLQLTIAIYMLYQELQYSTFVGISVTVLMLPMNAFLMSKIQIIQRLIMRITDERVRKTDEVLNGIKVIKLYGWEDAFTDVVESIRSRELGALKSRVKYSVIITFVWSCSPIMVSLFTFLCYSLLGNSLTSQKAFVALTLFNILRFPLVMLPNMISQLIQARVSMNRIKEFLALPELEIDAKICDGPDTKNAVEIENGEFSWDASSTENTVTLNNINIQVPRGKLVAVVGAVGSGKSSLVSAVLGEMDKMQGTVHLNGSVSYVPQVSWVLNDTLKNNILFGAEWDKCFYKQVIVNCALESDLQILPNGDATEIGEKGINLSGGQKQRVSLARAMYNRNDIYIFDDPLSAVDSHVGKHLFDKVIGPNGMVKDKTRLLVTHKLSVLPEVDHVIVMKDGTVLEQGTYSDLMSADNGELYRLVSSYEPDKVQEESEEPETELSEIDDVADLSTQSTDDVRKRTSTGDVRRRTRTKSVMSTCSIKGNNNKKDEKLIAAENIESGKIKWTVYRDYLSYMGVIFALIVTISFFAQYGCMLGSSLWLAKWSASNDAGGSAELAKWLGVYALFSILQAVFVLLFVMFMLFASIKASQQIHRLMFNRILRVPMSFFDTTPLGRILNRFSKDMNVIDEGLPNSLRSFFNVMGTVLFTIIIIGIAIPVMLPIFLPLAFLYIAVQKVYVPTARQLKRLESVSRSPVYNQFGETLNGLTSIRAYNKSEEFIKYNQGLVDDNVRSYYLNMMSNRWLSCRLEIIGHFVIFFTALTAVLYKGVNASQAGLAISYAMSVTQSLAWVVRMFSELETNIVSVERVKEYSNIAMEKGLTSVKPPDSTWPKRGGVVYKNVSVRYREGLDLVLKGLNFNIKPGERIGIVGRTGAGKSSITLTLFRILELASGSILIDGLDISEIGLHEVRKKISIIPQDPVLFSDTIRKNLDPFGQYSEEELWTALESASLKPYFVGQDKQLDFVIHEGGSNLSVGQRQLVCLARALLSDNKIIVMDEATAAVDMETDAIIQGAIRQTFAGRTILTIAHRLNTILDYDRILVLDKGEIAEFGSAEQLKKNGGVFQGMLADAGLLQMVPDAVEPL